MPCHLSVFTTDIWSSQSQDVYLSFNAHWISDMLGRERKLACMLRHLMRGHTGEHIKNVLIACMDKWQISTKLHLVLRDMAVTLLLGSERLGFLILVA